MIRFGSLLVFMASIGFVSVADAACAGDVRMDGDVVIAVFRSAGFKNPDKIKPMEFYEFTIVADGDWEFKPLKGAAAKGTFDAEDLEQWIEVIEDGIGAVASDPMLGALDEPYMEITLQTSIRKAKVRIRVNEELAQVVDEKIVELVKPGDVPPEE